MVLGLVRWFWLVTIPTDVHSVDSSESVVAFARRLITVTAYNPTHHSRVVIISVNCRPVSSWYDWQRNVATVFYIWHGDFLRLLVGVALASARDAHTSNVY